MMDDPPPEEVHELHLIYTPSSSSSSSASSMSSSDLNSNDIDMNSNDISNMNDIHMKKHDDSLDPPPGYSPYPPPPQTNSSSPSPSPAPSSSSSPSPPPPPPLTSPPPSSTNPSSSSSSSSHASASAAATSTAASGSGSGSGNNHPAEPEHRPAPQSSSSFSRQNLATTLFGFLLLLVFGYLLIAYVVIPGWKEVVGKGKGIEAKMRGGAHGSSEAQTQFDMDQNSSTVQVLPMELGSLKPAAADDHNSERTDALNARDMTPTQTDKAYHVSNRRVVPQLTGTAVPTGISAEELVSYKPADWMQAASGFEVHQEGDTTTSSSSNDNDEGSAAAAALRRRSLQAGGVARLRRRRHRGVPEQPADDEPKLKQQLFQLGSGGWLTWTPTGTAAAASLPTGTSSESDHQHQQHHGLDSELHVKKEEAEASEPREEMMEVTKTRGRRSIHPKIPVPISALHPPTSTAAAAAAAVDHVSMDGGGLGLLTTWHDHLPVVPPSLTPAAATAKPESSTSSLEEQQQQQQQQQKQQQKKSQAMEDAAALRFGQTTSMDARDQLVKRGGESWTKPRIPIPVTVSTKDGAAAGAESTPTAANRESTTSKKSSVVAGNLGGLGEKYGTGAQAAEGGALHADNAKMMQKGGQGVPLADGRGTYYPPYNNNNNNNNNNNFVRRRDRDQQYHGWPTLTPLPPQRKSSASSSRAGAGGGGGGEWVVGNTSQRSGRIHTLGGPGRYSAATAAAATRRPAVTAATAPAVTHAGTVVAAAGGGHQLYGGAGAAPAESSSSSSSASKHAAAAAAAATAPSSRPTAAAAASSASAASGASASGTAISSTAALSQSQQRGAGRLEYWQYEKSEEWQEEDEGDSSTIKATAVTSTNNIKGKGKGKGHHGHGHGSFHARRSSRPAAPVTGVTHHHLDSWANNNGDDEVEYGSNALMKLPRSGVVETGGLSTTTEEDTTEGSNAAGDGSLEEEEEFEDQSHRLSSSESPEEVEEVHHHRGGDYKALISLHYPNQKVKEWWNHLIRGRIGGGGIDHHHRKGLKGREKRMVKETDMTDTATVVGCDEKKKKKGMRCGLEIVVSKTSANGSSVTATASLTVKASPKWWTPHPHLKTTSVASAASASAASAASILSATPTPATPSFSLSPTTPTPTPTPTLIAAAPPAGGTGANTKLPGTTLISSSLLPAEYSMNNSPGTGTPTTLRSNPNLKTPNLNPRFTKVKKAVPPDYNDPHRESIVVPGMLEIHLTPEEAKPELMNAKYDYWEFVAPPDLYYVSDQDSPMNPFGRGERRRRRLVETSTSTATHEERKGDDAGREGRDERGEEEKEVGAGRKHERRAAAQAQ